MSGGISKVVVRAMVDSARRGESRAVLANRLGVDVGALDRFVEIFDETHGGGAWKGLIAEERVKDVDTAANWDEIENQTTERLLDYVKQGKVSRISDLLAIARTANTATRRGGDGVVPHSGSFKAGIQLPGGASGTFELRLGPNIASALEENAQAVRAPGDQPLQTQRFKRISTPHALRKLAEEDSVEDAELSEDPSDVG